MAAWTAVVLLALAQADGACRQDSTIPFSAIRAKALAEYQCGALAITSTPDGARLRCGFQKLDGDVTSEGLWLESTKPEGGGKLHPTAKAVSRQVLECGSPLPLSGGARAAQSGDGLPRPTTLSHWGLCDSAWDEGALDCTGTVRVEDRLVRFIRPGLTEEYSVSVGGVRQDFLVTERPASAGELLVELALSGARAEADDYGAKFILKDSGRTLAYSRLHVTDATGRELKARLEVLTGKAESRKQKAEMGRGLVTSAATGSLDLALALAVVVDDAEAVYPVRIDPTFSDANWVSLNSGMVGTDGGWVQAFAVDESGNVYLGGYFTVISSVVARSVAKWDGSTWSALGSGVTGGTVNALIADGLGHLFVGGSFSLAGTNISPFIARADIGLGYAGGRFGSSKGANRQSK